MKAYEAANKKKQSPAKQRNTAQAHPIKIEELEKAYNSNFLNKLNRKRKKSFHFINVIFRYYTEVL